MNDRFKEYVNRKQDLWRLIKKGVEVEYEYKFGQEQEDIGIDIKDDSDVEDDLNSIV